MFHRIFRNWKSSWSITILSIIIIIVPVAIYFKHFNSKYSTNSQDWANFSSYWLAFIGISNAIAIIFLTWHFQKHQKERDGILQRPIITIIKRDKDSQYFIKNIGNGVALNVLIYCSSKVDYEKLQLTQNRIAYSLGRDEEFTRSWLNGVLIIVEYLDIFNNKFYSMMQNDKLYLFDKSYSVVFNPDGQIEMSNKIKEYINWKKPERTWPNS